MDKPLKGRIWEKESKRENDGIGKDECVDRKGVIGDNAENAIWREGNDIREEESSTTDIGGLKEERDISLREMWGSNKISGIM